MRNNKKGIESFDTKFEIIDDETGESTIYEFTEKSKNFLRQFPPEGRGLALFGLYLAAEYGTRDVNNLSISDLMADVVLTYGVELIPQIADDAEIEGACFYVANEKDLENAVKNQTEKVPTIHLSTKDPYDIVPNVDAEYRYELLIHPNYSIPHEQSTEKFQYPGGVLPLLFRTKNFTDKSGKIQLKDMEMFDLYDKTGWISLKEILDDNSEQSSSLPD